MGNEAPKAWRSGMEWLILAAVFALGVPAAAWLGQERLIFFPQPITATTHLPSRAVPMEIVASDGIHLRGWMVRSDAAHAPAIIYFGGNAEEVSWTLADARWPRAWSLVAINYRGYGASEGAPGERELTTDALAIFDAVAQRDDVDVARIVVFGRSLGTALATHVAGKRPVAGAVLVSPFDSLAAIGQRHYPWLPVSLLLRHRFDTVDDAKQNRMPLLAIVAEGDSIIPVNRSRALFDAWAGPKRWLAVPREDHNSLGAAKVFWDGIAQFLAQR